ncbi:F-box family protein [Arabidopsis lyrata subsp. lyrata]|uniref:F-box family protein n=1 Tax=Arabidopsis lyrata subsp. lyrata TaxID=81972 RepID=D7L795_ARALL|nr:F-box family protein [Arabidopsis lyrata subsp. lyrata]
MMISDLPHELESEILSRVPTKSLAKLQTTCKRWYALFRDPRFVKKNFVISAFIQLPTISMEFTTAISEDLKITKIFHCDGLILCSTKENTRLVVWNPRTGQTRWIKRSDCYRSEDLYCLGYVNSKSSYHSHKILRYCFYYNDQNVCVGEFEIYDFSSDSWRVLDDCTHNWGLFCNGMSLKGNTYFVAGEQETGFFMLYFDFKTERFERLPLPYQSFDSEETAVLSVVREEKLAVLQQNIQALSNEMRIWVTNKIDEAKDLTWSNFVLTVDYDRFSLPSVNNVSSFLLDEENKVALCCDRDMDDEDKTRVYIVGETTYKEVYKETIKGSHFNWPLLLSYLPSLVHIHENTPKRQKKGKQEEVS